MAAVAWTDPMSVLRGSPSSGAGVAARDAGAAVPPSTRRAFDELTRAHYAGLRAFAVRLCGDGADANDLVQDTLERAYKRFDSLGGGANTRAWLFTILHNAFIDRCRRRKPERPTDQIDHVEDDAAHPPGEVPEVPAWAKVTAEQLRAAIEGLDPVFRVVYRMHAIEQRSYQDISAE